ncbi:hypothetical protein Glove_712g37 [Diversispora epigaea]|uniref:Programmed cell death protein 2 C-terminal domain-containing protein n=1 Tax=Diversispora epigaea TaxID=1348612 RepID=A0A397G254_9GLOM|nr:hypothetical protein Glove_712g37 [Diversispora epigaea]
MTSKKKNNKNNKNKKNKKDDNGDIINTSSKPPSSPKNHSLSPQQLEYSKKTPSTTTTTSSYSSIILGFPDDDYISLKEDNDPYATKIGGIPNWLIESCPASYDFMICKNCGKEMFLLFQGYVPLENSIYDRVIYVWGCNQQKCMKKHSGSFRVIRAHRLDEGYARKQKQQQQQKKEQNKINSQVSLISGFNLGEELFLSTSNSLTVDNNGLSVKLFRNEEDNTSPSSEKIEDVIATATTVSSIPKTWSQIVESNLNNLNDKYNNNNNNNSDNNESELCADINSKLSLQSSTTWPKKISYFPGKYIYVTEEIIESKSISLDNCKDYNNNNNNNNENGDWVGEEYEKPSLPKGVDKAFMKFMKRVNEFPNQCIRYEFNGQPLLYNQSDITAKLLLSSISSSQYYYSKKIITHKLPKCPKCGSIRVFEFQLMPNILCVLPINNKNNDDDDDDDDRSNNNNNNNNNISQFNFGMEWGTIMIFTCSKDCELEGVGTNNVSYYEELVLIQYEE